MRTNTESAVLFSTVDKFETYAAGQPLGWGVFGSEVEGHDPQSAVGRRPEINRYCPRR